MSSYDNHLKFDQCDCSSSTSCKITNGTRPSGHEDIVGLVIRYVDFWTTHGITLPHLILGFFLLIMTYVVVESFVGKQISIKKFILGPEIERNDPTIDNEG